VRLPRSKENFADWPNKPDRAAMPLASDPPRTIVGAAG
jgi:hypothetical protein